MLENKHKSRDLNINMPHVLLSLAAVYTILWEPPNVDVLSGMNKIVVGRLPPADKEYLRDLEIVKNGVYETEPRKYIIPIFFSFRYYCL